MRSKRSKKFAVSLGLSLLFLIFSWAINQNPKLLNYFSDSVPAGYYTVLNVEDGDTITVDMNGKPERIRFVGVDTPEIHDPRKPVQCFGQAAKEYTKRLIDNENVRLEADPLSTNRDRYSRLLRYAYLPDGRLVQAEVIKSGYGFAMTSFPFLKSAEFLNYQKQAMEGKRGLWRECNPTPNEYGGFTSNEAN